MGLRFASLALSVAISCTSPAKSINTPLTDIYSARPNMGSDMGQPSAFRRKPEETESTKSRRVLEGVQLSAFTPTFKFDNGDILYENGKGSAQISRGKEIILKGYIVGRHDDGCFTIRTTNDYEIFLHKSGLITTHQTPEEVRDRNRISK